jgi:hypothetical protein
MIRKRGKENKFPFMSRQLVFQGHFAAASTSCLFLYSEGTQYAEYLLNTGRITSQDISTQTPPLFWPGKMGSSKATWTEITHDPKLNQLLETLMSP